MMETIVTIAGAVQIARWVLALVDWIEGRPSWKN